MNIRRHECPDHAAPGLSWCTNCQTMREANEALDRVLEAHEKLGVPGVLLAEDPHLLAALASLDRFDQIAVRREPDGGVSAKGWIGDVVVEVSGTAARRPTSVVSVLRELAIEGLDVKS